MLGGDGVAMRDYNLRVRIVAISSLFPYVSIAALIPSRGILCAILDLCTGVF